MPLTGSTDEDGVCEKKPTASKTGFKVESGVAFELGFSVDGELGSKPITLLEKSIFVRPSSPLSRHRVFTNRLEYRNSKKCSSKSAFLSTFQASRKAPRHGTKPGNYTLPGSNCSEPTKNSTTPAPTGRKAVTKF